MTVAFAHAFAIAVGEEGGLTNDPADPGGLTKYGISQRAYPNLDIANLTIADAMAIFERDYWHHIAGDQLPAGLALLVFDAAVNNGLGRAARWLQAAVGTIEDGAIGPATLAAVAASVGHDPNAAAIEFMALRIAFMGGLPTWWVFGLGWARRLAALPYEAMAA